MSAIHSPLKISATFRDVLPPLAPDEFAQPGEAGTAHRMKAHSSPDEMRADIDGPKNHSNRRGPFFRVDERAADKAVKLKNQAFAVYCAMAYLENKERRRKTEWFPASLNELGKRAGVSGRTVQRALDSLENAGLIQRYSGCNARDQNTRNRYVIILSTEGICEPMDRTQWPPLRTQWPPLRAQWPTGADGHSGQRLKERRNIEPGAPSTRDSIYEEKETVLENVSGLGPANSQHEEEELSIDRARAQRMKAMREMNERL